MSCTKDKLCGDSFWNRPTRFIFVHSITMFVWQKISITHIESQEILMFVCLQKDARQCCEVTTPESIHTKDESKRESAFAFIFGVNWPVQWVQSSFVASQHCLASFRSQTSNLVRFRHLIVTQFLLGCPVHRTYALTYDNYIFRKIMKNRRADIIMYLIYINVT